MSNPYRVPSPPVTKPVPKTPLSTRVKVMRSYADRWAGYHHGQVIECQSTPDNHNYFCRVSTSAGTVRLAYDEAGNSEPFMIVRDTQQ